MENLTEYITTSGERWDTIAYKAYGDVSQVSRIIEANPQIPVTATLEAGVRLNLPIIEPIATELDTNLLPPWKR